VGDVLVVGNSTWSYGAALDRQLSLQERTMTTDPTFTARGTDERQGNGRHRVSDLLLVVGIAAVVFGMVLVSQGVPPLQSAAHLDPNEHAAPIPTDSAVPALDERLAADMSPSDRVPPTPGTIGSSAIRVAAACTPRLDLDHDLRLVLAAMALQQRRTLRPTAHFGRPDKQDIPVSALILAKGSVATAEASPPAARPPMGPACWT